MTFNARDLKEIMRTRQTVSERWSNLYRQSSRPSLRVFSLHAAEGAVVHSLGGGYHPNIAFIVDAYDHVSSHNIAHNEKWSDTNFDNYNVH